MKRILAAIVVPLTLVVSGPAPAEIVSGADIYTRISGPELAQILQDAGYRATLSTDDYGDPQIDSAAGGIDFQIFFYGCSSDAERQCDMIMFSFGADLPKGSPLDVVNTWNREQFIGQAYLDEENDPFLTWPISVVGGVAAEQIQSSLGLWETSLPEFTKAIGW